MTRETGHGAETLFGPEVLVACSALDASPEDVPPLEAAYIETAVESRRREFATGRTRARELLTRVGFPAFEIARDEDRVPIWPAGIVGSISHTKDLCLVAVARERACRGLGVDVEIDQRMKEDLLEAICTESERAWVATDADGLSLATMIFSAKEAVYKSCFPSLRERWGFHEVEIRVDAAAERFEASVPASAGGRMEGRILRRNGRILTGVLWT